MLEPIYKLIYKANAGIADAKAELASRKSGRVELPLIGLHGETLCLTALPKLTQQASTLYTLYDKVPRNRKSRHAARHRAAEQYAARPLLTQSENRAVPA